jgi:hypothetical protein
MKRFKKLWQKFWPEFLFIVLALAFSGWLMGHTFAYHQGIFFVAAKAWSDFASHLPLIRSFSWGQNWPPQFPLFPGPFIHYHFLFYALVGFLEKTGLPFDWALNLPSALSFFGLLLVIYFFAKTIFKSRFVGFLSIVLFLFNGSFSFLEFFKKYPLSLKTPLEIFKNNVFPSFGPYGPETVSAFWNLNIYTNQRHLALSFTLIILAVLLLVKPLLAKQKITYRRTILLGLLLGFIPFLHSAVFAMGIIIFASLLVLLNGHRQRVLILLAMALSLGLPQLFLMQTGGGITNFKFNPGYLIANNLTFSNFIYYWFLNLGLVVLLIPVGLAKASLLAKKVFLSFLSLFIIGNLFQFSPEIAGNHKFFNLFLIIGNMFGAYTIFIIWQRKIWGKVLSLIIVFFLTLSGIIDFFPIKNDSFIAINDAPKNPDILWIKENTPPKSVFLNSSFLYHQASLAGRKIFLGWPYFAWSAGYGTEQRNKIMKNIYESQNKEEICQLLINNKIDYFTIENTKGDENLPQINLEFFQMNFQSVYKTYHNDFQIYEVKLNCPI